VLILPKRIIQKEYGFVKNAQKCLIFFLTLLAISEHHKAKNGRRLRGVADILLSAG
jgi:hypothetical protein